MDVMDVMDLLDEVAPSRSRSVGATLAGHAARMLRDRANDILSQSSPESTPLSARYAQQAVHCSSEYKCASENCSTVKYEVPPKVRIGLQKESIHLECSIRAR